MKLCEFTIKDGKIVKYHGLQPCYLELLLTGDNTLLMNGEGEDKPLGMFVGDENSPNYMEIKELKS